MTNKIEEGVVTCAKFSADYANGYGFIDAGDGVGVFFSSTSIYQNRGVPDQIESGDRVSFQRFEMPKKDRGPSCRRVWLKSKTRHGREHITYVGGD